MKERTVQILTTLIEEFIETANPVASKQLLEYKEFDISSATVRNEFAILEEVGLIKSPHVSAGKIPTQKGYRYFVDQMTQDEKDDQIVSDIFSKYIQEYKLSKSKEVVFDILRIISRLSSNVAFATVENDKTVYIGLSNVLRSPEFIAHPEQVAQIAEILEGKDRFQIMLNTLALEENEIKIFIGEENLLKEISSCAMVIARYNKAGIAGYIGILGPMRMKYGFNKALIRNAIEML